MGTDPVLVPSRITKDGLRGADERPKARREARCDATCPYSGNGHVTKRLSDGIVFTLSRL